MAQPTLETIMKKVEELKASGTADLSTEEDLSIAIMNLISLEEHFFFTAEKTRNDDYFDWMRDIRELRKELLARMIPKNEGETWCASKHLLSASMRLFEVGTKLKSDGDNKQAKMLFDRAFKLYSIFWALRLKLISTSGMKALAPSDAAWGVEDIVTKLVNCCDE